MNRSELVDLMSRASSELLREKGFISFVDVLIRMGKLSKEDYESWRMRRIPFLERAIKLNLGQINHLSRTLRQNAVKGDLRPSKTAYVSWGKGPKQPLRFSKSGHPAIEEAYATHFVKREQSVKDNPSDPSHSDRGASEVAKIASEGTQDDQAGGVWSRWAEARPSQGERQRGRPDVSAPAIPSWWI